MRPVTPPTAPSTQNALELSQSPRRVVQMALQLPGHKLQEAAARCLDLVQILGASSLPHSEDLNFRHIRFYIAALNHQRWHLHYVNALKLSSYDSYCASIWSSRVQQSYFMLLSDSPTRKPQGKEHGPTMCQISAG